MWRWNQTTARINHKKRMIFGSSHMKLHMYRHLLQNATLVCEQRDVFGSTRVVFGINILSYVYYYLEFELLFIQINEYNINIGVDSQATANNSTPTTILISNHLLPVAKVFKIYNYKFSILIGLIAILLLYKCFRFLSLILKWCMF